MVRKQIKESHNMNAGSMILLALLRARTTRRLDKTALLMCSVILYLGPKKVNHFWGSRAERCRNGGTAMASSVTPSIPF